MRLPVTLRSGLALLLLALASTGALAQPFAVVSSQPADHTAGVALETTLAFTFSGRVLDYEAALDSAPTLAVFPAESAVVGPPARSADGLTLTFPVTLQPDTRYVFLLLAADAEAGAGLSTPYALNLTTAASNGGFTVRGTVTATGGLAPDGAIVALVTGDLATGDVQIVNADVVEGGSASLPYVLGPVPFGLYTAGAVLLPLPLGATTDGFGYGLYDPDGDGTPNPIFATTGVNVAVAPPPPRTAGDGIDEVQATADEALGADALLSEVGPAVVDAAGASPVWRYRFYSMADGGVVEVVRLGLFALPFDPGFSVVGPAVSVPLLLDSDGALESAESLGGADFRAAHPGETVTVAMRLEALSGIEVWTATYAASGGDTATVLVTVGVDAGEGGPAAEPRRLSLRSANPARGPVEATLALDAPAGARVTVVDARGRTVAVLLDGPLGAGVHALVWTPAAGVPAGVYWLRAEAGGRTEALAVTRVR